MHEIYLDNAATTKTSSEAASEVAKIMCTDYGNPSSLHTKGFAAQKILEKAQTIIGNAIGADSDEVVFTSGGTEANNLAILGTARALRRQGKKIVTTKVEHSSVLEPMKYLEQQGFIIEYIEPLKDGSVDIEAVLKAVDYETIMVSAMMVNSEVGAISAIDKMIKLIKRKNSNVVCHTDAVQAFSKIPFSVKKLGVDLLSISGHKIHSPKGVGALYVKKGTHLVPLVFGGGQQRGVRSGTENMPGIAALGKVVELSGEKWSEDFAHIVRLYKYFVNKCENSLGLRINSSPKGSPYICNISVPGYKSEILLHYLEEHGIYVSSGSACSKGAKSHVLKAMGLSNQRIDSAIRVSFCTENTTKEIDDFFEVLQEGRQQLIRG